METGRAGAGGRGELGGAGAGRGGVGLGCWGAGLANPEFGLVDRGEDDEAGAGLLQDERVDVGEGGLEDLVDALHVLPDGLGRERDEAAEDEQEQQADLLRRLGGRRGADAVDERGEDEVERLRDVRDHVDEREHAAHGEVAAPLDAVCEEFENRDVGGIPYLRSSRMRFDANRQEKSIREPSAATVLVILDLGQADG